MSFELFGLSLDWISFIVFIVTMGLVVYFDRKKMKRDSVVFIRRTQKGKNFIDKLTKKSPRFWNAFFGLGAILAIPLMLVSLFVFIFLAFQVLTGTAQVGAGLVIPGPTSEPLIVPGLFVLPWWIWAISLPILVIIHEFSHGITCRLHNVGIRSVGWIFLLILPAGAFVEQNDSHIKKKTSFQKITIYVAGSFSNLVTSLVFLLVIIYLTPILFVPQGLVFTTYNNTPAWEANLTGAIVQINDHQIKSIDDIQSELSNYRPGEVIEVKTVSVKRVPIPEAPPEPPIMVLESSEVSIHKIKLASHPENITRSYMGIEVGRRAFNFTPGLNFMPLYVIVFYLYLLSLAIGLVNLLPAKPLDGGLIYEEIVSKFTKNPKPIVTGTAYAILLLLIITVVGPYLINL